MADQAQSVQQTAEIRSVARLATAADLNDKVEKLRRSRSRLETQWKLNLAFFKGRQYTYWNRAANKLMELPTHDAEKPRYRVRLVSNQISKNSLRLLAKLTKTKPMFGATPGNSDDSAVKAAEAAQALAEHWWSALNLADKYRQALMWMILAGKGWWLIDWDKFAGSPMTFMVNPQDGQPITNDGVRNTFAAQLQQAGMDPTQFEKTVYLGDVRVRVLSPFQVFVDPTAEHVSQAKYAICELQLDPEEIMSRWGVKLTPDSVPTPADQGLDFLNGKEDSDRCTKRVYCGYFLPTPLRPEGRYVCWTDDIILEDGPYQYSHNQLPLIDFPGIPNPGSAYDMSIVEGAIDDQKEYNKTLSQIVTYKNLMVSPQWIAPRGSIRERITTEPGAVINATPIGGLMPQPVSMPALQPYVLEHLANNKQRLDEDFFLTAVSEGTLPPNVEAGIAIDMLQEASTDAIAPLIMAQEDALSQALMLLLRLAKLYYTEPRMIQVAGTAGSTKVKSFLMSTIDDGCKIHVESFSSMPRSRAGRQYQILEFIKAGVIPPDQAWRYLDMANLKSLEVRFRADEDMAEREHEKILRGEPLNPIALQQAMQALQQPDPQTGQPVNPDTGQPFQSQDEIQHYLEDASLKPFVYENYSVSLDVHGLKLKSLEYDTWPDDVKRQLARHFELTLQTLLSLPSPTQPAQAPRISLQAKMAVDATTASQLLNKAGVPATPDQLQQPPLETWVSDDTAEPDDPNAFVAGHQMYMQQIQQQQQQLSQMEQQQAQMAQQGQDMANKQELHHQKVTQAAQAHSQKLAHAQAQHEAHLSAQQAQAKAASRKPPPSGSKA